MKHLLKNKNKPESFEGMSQKEKKEFLSMDLIERLIRIEQRVSAKFHKFVRYNETEYYKSLPEQKKKEFEKYLKRKKINKIFTILALLAPWILLTIFKFGISGRVVDNDTFSNASLEWTSIGLFVFILFCLMIKAVSSAKRAEKINSHFKILENAFS
jgi:hypothetical protein